MAAKPISQIPRIALYNDPVFKNSDYFTKIRGLFENH